ncbi:MAG: PfkB family carbohydrate kinase [Actinomycetota bacterium]|nr:PfkB family carbohydrate kinase [Actinomycetota bacterium]
MRFGILGPLTITDDLGAPLAVSLEPKQEILLIALAANVDRGVPLHELVLAVHGTTETALYKRSIESLVSRLRSSLRAIDDGDRVVPPARGGVYRLDVPEQNVDALRFLRRAEHLLNNWTTVPAEERNESCAVAISEWRADPARVYSGTSGSASDLFRRFTATLAELGDRYCRVLLSEQRIDEARRTLSRLVELMPGHRPFLQLQQEAVNHGLSTTSPTAPATDRRARAGTALAELRDRIMGSSALPRDAFAVTAHNLDRIYLVDRVAPDHEVKIDVAWEEPGGSGANTVAALGRLGCTVAVAGIVADDGEGRILRDSLSSAGVDCTDVLVAPAGNAVRSGHSVIFSDRHGVRSIYVHPGVNESFTATLAERPDGLARLVDRVGSSRIVHFTSFTSPGELGLQEYLAGTLPADAVLSLNPGALYSTLGLDRLDPILSRANVLSLYEQNLRELVQNSAAPVVDAGESGMHADLNRLYAWKRMKGYDQPLVTLVKRHRSSVSPASDQEYLTIACGRFAVEEIVGTQARIVLGGGAPVTDSTGAGDGMAAALLFCLLRGASLRECADLAFLLGSMVSGHVGARGGHPTRDELRCAWRELFPGVPEPPALAVG